MLRTGHCGHHLMTGLPEVKANSMVHNTQVLLKTVQINSSTQILRNIYRNYFF